MAYHWLTFLVGVTILRGSLLSPIPIGEEEWAEFNKLLRDDSYRLPATTKPSHYIVNLTPYFETNQNGNPFTFAGSVAITIRAEEADVQEIVMHCNDLNVESVLVEFVENDETKQIQAGNQILECDPQYNFLKISTTEALKLDTDYTVKLNFIGNIQSNMRGFYRSWYVDSTGNKRWMGTTQFQPGHARQAFPCYDEPAFKATFDITINREEDFSPTLSNMPIKETEELSNGRIAETFYTTPKTSTYLLAFIVSHYENIAEGENKQRPFKIYARDNARGTGEWALEIGEKLLAAMDQYTNIPYYQMADQMDMKQAAIPDFSAGAMENWGLLTYREALILYDENNSNHFYKQRVANIVSHEIAHMWFGNLVTCAWWNNLWLNEGFARFYQYYLTQEVEPELGYATRFIVEQLLTSMREDSLDSAHALTESSVYSPTQVSNHFSTITYAKGASVLRMTQHLLGEDTYVKGLQKYLDNRKFDVAEPHHLFEALDAAAEEDESLSNYQGITVDRYFKTWSEKPGHPVLNVNIDQDTGKITVVQGRWHIDGGMLNEESLWDIPITWTRAEASDFEDLKPSQIITEKTTTIERGTQGREWIVFNKQATGFYRINYDNTNWAMITQALRRDVNVIHEYNRAQIVDDAFAFGRAKVMPYSQTLSIISFLEFDDQYAPWMAAISGFNFLRRRLAHDDTNTQNLQTLMNQLSKAVTTRLGFEEKSNEPFMDGLLRMNVMQFFCSIGHTECIQAGVENFQKWKNDETYSLPANMRPWVYCTGLRNGGADDFDYFWSKYLVEDLASEQIVMIEAAGCTGHQGSLVKFLNAIMENEDVIRPQDASTALRSAVSGNEMNTRRVFDWLRSNVDKVTNRFGSISPVLNLITPRLLTIPDMEQVTFWLDKNKETIGEQTYNNAVAGIENAQDTMSWTNERLEELLEYFENGYEEETPITEAPVSTTESATTEDPGDGGGAATITLSVVALLVSLSINFLN